ncbi:acyl-coenzyme A thioesterase 1-like isoform X4 [Scylla paramamosain]
MATSALQQVTRVVVEPPSCLHDESVNISVDGLTPEDEVTLVASMTDTRGVLFMSFAHYKADGNGQVDVSTMESLGGSYRGVFTMGLLSSLLPALEKHKFTRFFKRDVENPNIVTVSVFQGHLSNEELVAEDRSEPLSTATHLRHYMAPGVQRIPVRYGKVRGCLFLPPGDGPFPGVVDMFGSAGGLLEYRSAQLASRGIASLALAFFAYDDLPKSLEEFNMAYFEEAVEFLLKHEKVEKPNMGVIGISKGGDLALSMSTFIPEVTAGVCINGSISNIQSRLNLHDRSIPGLDFDLGKIEIVDGTMDCYESVNDPKEYPETIIPIERADANFLFLVSCDDRNWKSEMFADLAVERLRLAGKTNYTVNKYPGAGHLLEPPYSTFCWASYHKMIRASMLWGGSLRPHIDAQVHAWNTLLTFLGKHLRNQTSKGKL